jgi:hypothetical protein
MPEPDAREDRLWESGWQGHADAQRARLARLPLREKLRWLEEAQEVLRHLRRGPRAGGSRPPPVG